ncbi:MAG: hypothetical protein ACL93V_00220 [Candidatus Electrothrix sp. YB6]
MSNEEKAAAFNKEIVAKLKTLSDEDMLEVLQANNSILKMAVEYQNNNNKAIVAED